MSELILQNVTKIFGNITALNDVSFTVNDNEFFVLLGPTGAGKSTTLRVVCGLEKPDSGHVLLDGQVCDDVSPSDRDVAIVFQQYSLYPTMTVYENMAFPLKAPGRKLPKAEIKTKNRRCSEKTAHHTSSRSKNSPTFWWRDAARFHWPGNCSPSKSVPNG